MSLDPKLGKLSVPQTLNRYVYCINNPLRYVDPTGMDFWNDLVDQATGIWIAKWISSTADWYSHASDAERAGFWSGIAAGIVAGVAIGLAPFSGGASLLLLATIPAITGAAVYAGVTLACGGQPTIQGMLTTAGWAGLAGMAAGGATIAIKPAISSALDRIVVRMFGGKSGPLSVNPEGGGWMTGKDFIKSFFKSGGPRGQFGIPGTNAGTRLGFGILKPGADVPIQPAEGAWGYGGRWLQGGAPEVMANEGDFLLRGWFPWLWPPVL